jgi:osmotically-inducible protein OsmY
MNLFAIPNIDGTTRTSDGLTATAHEAQRLLHASSYSALCDISCLARDGVLYLYGRLPSYYLKQVAQEIASGVEGVRLVMNRIEVSGKAVRDGALRSG